MTTIQVGNNGPDSLNAEIVRLTECLKTANKNHEHFEREWYLRGDAIEKLEIELGLFRETVGIRADAKACANDINHWCKLMDKADSSVRLETTIRELKELLKILEWDHISTDNGDFVYCSICQAEYSTYIDKVKRVHKPDCKLKIQIGE